MVRNGNILAEQTFTIAWNEIESVNQIETPLDNQDEDGTLIEQNPIQKICDFITCMVCQNYSKLVSMSDLLMSIGQLRNDSNKDFVIVYDDYVNVIRSLKDAYEEIVDNHTIYYEEENIIDRYSPLQREDAIITIPENAISRVDSNDIHLVTGSTNNYYIENQTVSGTSNPYTWVV